MLRSFIQQELENFEGKTSILIKDFNEDDGLFVDKDSTQQVVSASIIKVPIMLAVFELVQKLEISLDQYITVNDILPDTNVFEFGQREYSIGELLEWMIIQSDNTATNTLIDFIGMSSLNTYFESLGLNQTILQRKMLDFQSVQMGKQNYTSAIDMYRVMSGLYHKTILTPQLCNKAIEILLRQRYKQCIERYLYDASVAHKTGELDNLQHDVGIMFHKQRACYFGVFTYECDIEQACRFMGRIGKKLYEEIR